MQKSLNYKIMTKYIKYSIIIPTFNSSLYIKECINSILQQKHGDFFYEIIIIDDCSTDNTNEIISSLESNTEIKLFKTIKNSGPGIARNIGIKKSTGDWILFLDSDDKLEKNGLSILTEFIKLNNSSDVITYNWDYDINSTAKRNKSGGRYDLHSFSKTKKDLINDYISLGMDGSAIYTLVSADLLKGNNILFRAGLHEDVDFIFKVYYLSNKITVLEDLIYIKNNRHDSIVNTISEKHIKGFFYAYEEIYDCLKEDNLINNTTLNYIYIGVVGIVASRVREIWSNGTKQKNISLYLILYKELNGYVERYLRCVNLPDLKTRFLIIYKFFIELMDENEDNIDSKLDDFMPSVIKKSWSCYDLHYSLFLAPNEIRTCCKRFFDEGKMKGDVVLLTNKFDIKNILKAKKNLYTDINKGQSNECNNCPFLEFKEWGYIDNLKIEHLSFEYHSVCNMKCIYCDDIYYGGKKPIYDVAKLLDDLIINFSLDNCKSIVWGGGEPTVDNDFKDMFKKTAGSFKYVKQRIITNAIVFVDMIQEYVSNDQATITTSIDAGTKETFYLVRKNSKFLTVFENLKKYASDRPENITIKYILMDENKSIDELESFVNLIKRYELQKCNFQISFDFKKDLVDVSSTISMIVLYGLLIDINARLVFFDDLLLQRFKSISNHQFSEIYKELKLLGYNHMLLDSAQYEKIIIWGAGVQTKSIIENSSFLKGVEVAYIVDNDKNKINTKFLGYDVYDPEILKGNDINIFISAVQNTPKILEEYSKLGLNENRLIKGLLF